MIYEDVNQFDDLKNDKIGISLIYIKKGFETNDLILITEQDLFGKKIIKPSYDSKQLEKLLMEQNNLNIGDLIIHKEYGLGRLIALDTIEVNNIKNDFLKIEYNNNTNLFIPIEDFDLITRYGDYEPNIILDQLGNIKWQSRKNKIKNKLNDIAKELVKIASLRKISKAPILVANNNEYEEFCSKFPYIETKDQLKAIKNVEEDLTKGIPMDRLICGDVGFGKTEIALRASFIATNNENNPKQVAIICPTTLLSRQHYNLFKDRFEYTKINIAMISRLCSDKENKKNKLLLENGEIDIIIGTHALLTEKIKFKNLGLLIVDEEQRFGVKQKERLKALNNNIHLLTLSATPIPRTLQMSMVGIRDLSLIATPPTNRLNINTYVMNFDEIILHEAIMREINRNGKVIIVVPRISDIQEIEFKLKNILSKTRYNIAHGQMKESTLDFIVNDFYEGKSNILISTAIVESGLDIPNLNTIIVYRADKFGLSQLHQLRGRVGRGNIQAYAYLTVNHKEFISENAKKRLHSIEENQNIGCGFSIANNDMEIRGGGNLLGEEQSGHIREVGIELYNQMLVEEVEKIKLQENVNNQQIYYDFTPQIKLNISTSIDKNYINDIASRLSYYKRLANIKTENDEKIILMEIEDKFGSIPIEIYNIIEITKIKNLCKDCQIVKLENQNNTINITFFEDTFQNPEYLIQLIKNNKATMKKQNILTFLIDENKKIENIKSILNDLKFHLTN